MKNITVSKADLITKITSNRAKHAQEYTEAHAGWRTAVLEALAKAQTTFADTEDTSCLYDAYRLAKPEDHTDDYDRVLGMLDWDESDRVVLSDSDFARFIQDDWEWSHGFRAQSSAYTVARA